VNDEPRTFADRVWICIWVGILGCCLLAIIYP
jgi:hypothetical protein